jgi:hypothetical protein
LVGAGVLAAGLLLAVPATAQPGDSCPEGSGAAGHNCVIHVDDALQAGLHVGVHVNLGDCESILNALVRVQGQESTERQTLITDEQAARDAKAKLAAAKTADDNARAADLSEDTAKPDTTVDIQDTDRSNADAALVNAQAASTAADKKLAADKRRENSLITVRVKLGGDYDRCKTPPTTEPPTTTAPPVVLPGPVVQGPATVLPGPIVQEPAQIGQVPVGAAPTGALTEDQRYLG